MKIKITNKQAVGLGGFMVFVFLLLLWYEQKQAPPIIDMRGKLPTDPNKKLPTRSLEQIEFITVHHTAGAPQSLEYYARLHISKSDVEIAYPELIDEKGNVYICHDPTTISYHNENNNTRTYGICLIGNYEGKEPTAAQLQALEQRIKYNRKRFPNPVDVAGHGEFKATACPGKHLQKHLQKYKLRA